MRQIIARAWKDTAESYGLTLGTGFRSLVVPITMFVLFYHVLGAPEAVSEGVKIALSLVAAGAAGFLPLFLWNLWLAPYKILNERLGTVSDAQTPPKEVDEEAKLRSRLHIKQQDTLRELKTMRECIESRESFRHDYPHVQQGIWDFDYEFQALREKYSHWFPPDLKEREMRNWAGRIIATLNTNDYEDAVRRIEQAAHAKSWRKQDDDKSHS